MVNFYEKLIKDKSEIKVVNDNINDFDFISLENKSYNLKNLGKCPYCKSKEFIKYGMYNGNQRYKCKDNLCGKTFTSEFYNKFRYSKKFKEKYKEYFELLNKGLTLRECAEKLNITFVTSFFWRHRFLVDFKSKYYLEKISSHVELSKMRVIENFKGARNLKDIKRDEITVITALNDSKDIIPIIAARKFFGFYEIRDNIIPRLNKNAYVVGVIDGKLKNFAKAFNKIYKAKFKKEYENRIDITYSVNTKKWLYKFRGIASKYLDSYLYWRLFEYKKDFQFNKDTLLNKEKKSDCCLKYEINSYISWKNIKAQKLIV